MTKRASIWAMVRGFLGDRSGLSTAEYGIMFAAGMMVTIPAANTLYTTFRATLQNTHTNYQQPDARWVTHEWDGGNDNFVDTTTGSGYHRYEIAAGSSGNVIYTYNTTDVIAFGEGITADMLTYTIVDGNLNIFGGGASVTVIGCHHPHIYCVEAIQLADGTVINPTQAHIVIDASVNEGQTLYGMNYNMGGGNEFRLRYGSGQRIIDTYMSNDTIIFEEGISPDNVTYKMVDGSLVIAYDNDGDSVTIQGCHYRGEEPGQGNYYCVETLQFADGTTLNPNAQAMQIYASENAGALYGMEFYDSMNEFHISLIDGDRTIYTNGTGVTDTLILGGVDPRNIQFSRFGDDLVLNNANTGQAITIHGCNSDNGDTAGHCVETIQFDNGTVWMYNGQDGYDPRCGAALPGGGGLDGDPLEMGGGGGCGGGKDGK